MPELVYDVKFRIDPASAQRVAGAASGVGGGGTAGAAQGAEKAAQEVKQLQASVQRADKAVEDLGNQATKSFGQARKSITGASNAAIDFRNKMGVAASRTTKDFSSANQVLFSFSDGINDAAQFSQGFGVGMRAVGNNIGFTIELLTSLNNRVQQHNALVKAGAIENGKMMTTFGMLRASLTGPGGLLLAVNAIITVMTVLGTRTKEAEKEMNRLGEVARELRGIGDLDFGIADRLESEEKAVVRVIEQFRVLEDAQKQLQAEIALSAAFGRNEEFIKAQERAINDQKEAVLVLAQSYGFEEKSLKELETRLNGVTKARQLLTGATDDAEIALGAFVDTIQGRVNEALLRQELGLFDVNEEIDRQREFLESLVYSWTLLAQAGDSSIIPFLKRAKDALADINLDELDPRVFDYDVFEIVGEIAADNFLNGFIIAATESTGIDRALALLGEEMAADIQAFAQKVVDPVTQEFTKSQQKQSQEATKNRVKQITDAVKQAADAEVEIIRQAEAAKQGIWSASFGLFSTLSQSASGRNEQLALALLAVEKGLKIAEIIVSAKSSIAKITAATAVQTAAGDPTAKARAARNIALVKGSAAISIAAIIAQGLAKGGGSVGGGGGGGGAAQAEAAAPFGFQMNEVQGAQTFQTPGFVPQNGMMGKETPIKVEILADGKQLYSVVKRGEEQYRQRSV